MDTQLVTVIIPTRDRPRRLQQALQSVLQQGHRPLELLVVNDGGCPPVLDAGGQRGVALRMLSLPESLGPGRARRQAQGQGQGQGIGWGNVMESQWVAPYLNLLNGN